MDFAAVGERSDITASDDSPSNTHYRIKLVEGTAIQYHDFRQVRGIYLEYTLTTAGIIQGRRYLRR